MLLEDKILDFVKTFVDKYYSVKSAKYLLVQEFKGLLQQFNVSFDRIVYQSNGVTGIYQDMIVNQQNVMDRITSVKNHVVNLESILFDRHKKTYQNFSNGAELNVKEKKNHEKPKRFSRVKSAVISTVIGISTAVWLYKNMCNTKNNIPEDSSTSHSAVPAGYTLKYTPESLNQIILLKNKYFWKDTSQLQEIVETEAGLILEDVRVAIKEAMILKTTNPIYSGIARINYDSRISSKEMKDEIVNLYTSSDKTLKEISADLEKKYGMYISSSTISRNARKYLEAEGLSFKNRRETKNYYTKNSH